MSVRWLAAFRACDETDPGDIGDRRRRKPVLSASVTNVRRVRIVESPAPTAADYAYAADALRLAENAFSPGAMSDEAELRIRGELP